MAYIVDLFGDMVYLFCAMSIVDAIILGIVEGVTEYLPVSSTGHLLVAEYLLGMEKTDAIKAFTVVIQGGAIAAVLGLYYKYVKSMVLGLLGKDPKGLKLAVNILLAFIPAVVIGLLFDDLIKEKLFGNWPIAIAWFFGGLAILVYARYRARKGESKGRSIDELTAGQALYIGLLQCVAMWPGTSRSLMTMLGGMFVGLSVVAAVEFSFLLGLVTLGAATCYDAMKHGREMVSQIGWESMAVGTFFAWLSAVIAIKWMISYLQRHSFSIFGWYRIFAAVVLVFLMTYRGM